MYALGPLSTEAATPRISIDDSWQVLFENLWFLERKLDK